MPSTNQLGIYELVGVLRARTKRSYEKIRERMADYLGVEEYARNMFYNKFRRADRNPNYELREMKALISAFVADLRPEKRCTAYEACQLFGFAKMSLQDFDQLKEFFGEKEYLKAATQFINESGFDLANVDQTANSGVLPRQLVMDYLDALLDKHRIWRTLYTPVAGIDYEVPSQRNVGIIETSDVLPMILEDFDQFVDDAFKVRPVQSYTEDVLEVIGDDFQQIVILGEAGSGKTTILRYIAANLAEKAKESSTHPLPVLIELGKLENNQTIEQKILQQLNALIPWYPQLRESGRLILLFDGINEIPVNILTSILAEIRSLVRVEVSNNRFLAVTCRVSDYTHDVDVGISRRLLIKPLDPVRIHQFIDIYVRTPVEKREDIFWALAGNEAKRFWDHFRQVVGDYPEIFWLADQLPADSMWGYGGEATQYFYWNQWLEIRKRPASLLDLARNPYMLLMIIQVFAHLNQVPTNRALLFHAFIEYTLMRREGLSAADTKELIEGLSSLAFAMEHSKEPTSTSMSAALVHLKDVSSLRRAQGANILEADEDVRFTHQLLREYFAALKLDSWIGRGASVGDYWSPERWWLPNRWDDVAILASGMHTSDMSVVVTWLQDAAPEIAARCITESGGEVSDLLRHMLAKRWLSRLGENPILARSSIGCALGIIGIDSRSGVGLTLEKLPAIDWVDIPAGTFIFGNGETRQTDSFAISRYPVTHIQFQAFIDADDGFACDEWWKGLGQREKKPGIPSFPYANHPRERVNWYDALAFCRWLSAHLGYDVTLPTEIQWEKSARGTDGRIYPYGSEFDALRGNVKRTGIEKTSAVGLFPEGVSPYGVFDLSGNVFEWCLNLESAPDRIDLESREKRSLRGGSWAHSHEQARADTRYANRPELRRNRVGFRIVRP